MLNFIKNFAAKDDGAVTVDWVVLTAAVIGLGYGVFSLVESGADGMAKNVETELQTAIDGDINS